MSGESAPIPEAHENYNFVRPPENPNAPENIIDAEIVEPETGTTESPANLEAGLGPHTPDAIEAQIVTPEEEARLAKERRDVGETALNEDEPKEGTLPYLMAAMAARKKRGSSGTKPASAPTSSQTSAPESRAKSGGKESSGAVSSDEKDRQPFGPAEHTAYTANKNKVRLAEKYATPGTAIDWENHHSTNTADADRAEYRKAIITDTEGNKYYLRGQQLFDIAASEEAGTPKAQTLSEDTKADDPVIGEASNFSNGNAISSVEIATGLVNDNDSRVDQENLQGQDPFADLDKKLARLTGAPRAKQEQAQALLRQLPLTGATFPETTLNGVEVRGAQDFRFTREEELRAREAGDHYIGGKVTNLTGKWKELDEKLDILRATSEHGHIISPGPGIKPPAYDKPEQHAAIMRIYHENRENPAKAQELIAQYMDSEDEKVVKRTTHAKTGPYTSHNKQVAKDVAENVKGKYDALKQKLKARKSRKS